MGFLLDIAFDEKTLVVTFFRILSIGIAGDIDDEYLNSTLHLSLWKLQLTTSIGWSK